jgi:hypothetical protein
MNRRRFLKSMGMAAAGGAVIASPWLRRKSYAAPFGEFPPGAESLRLPTGQRAERVLEIFLYGGLSMWETLYLVQSYGTPGSAYPNTQYWALSGDAQSAMNACGVPTSPIGQTFATDALGADVELGPFAHRLWNRPDITSRMRLVVQRHSLEPHEAAVPQALTGKPVGQPSAAGLGTHIQRHFLEGGTAPDRASPWSYVFATGGISSDNVAAAAATGAHPGAARPLLIKTDAAAGLTTLLSRSTVGADRAAADAAAQAYLAQFNQRLTWPGQGRVRSPKVDDLAIALTNQTRVDAIGAVLDPTQLANRNGTACGITRRDIPHMALNAARHLLTHPTEPARYVCVSDIGLYEASGGGGYDTHTDNAIDTARNFDNIIQGLITILNGPGETDPTKLSLDDTLIILSSEFGRTPGTQSGNGRNHWPYGYVSALIGGPIDTAQAGIYGAIGPDGRATQWATPSENRIGALLGMGIWPFSPEGFGVSDVMNGDTEENAARTAISKVLGIQL